MVWVVLRWGVDESLPVEIDFEWNIVRNINISFKIQNMFDNKGVMGRSPECFLKIISMDKVKLFYLIQFSTIFYFYSIENIL